MKLLPSFRVAVVWSVATCSVISAEWTFPVSPFAQGEPLSIERVSPPSSAFTQFTRIEFTIDLTATFDNPFVSADIAVEAEIRAPSGRALRLPGYFDQSYVRALERGQEVLTRQGDPAWKIRFTPVESGPYTMSVVARDRSGTVRSVPVAFSVRSSSSPGFIRISARDKRYFAFDNGAPYFPIGANTCWAYARGTYDYDAWFARYAEAGANYGRLWLSPHWTTFALERSGPTTNGLGLGQFDLANAWRIDYVLELASRLGLKLMLCIDSYNILREKNGYPQWENTPHNIAHGGPLHAPAEFWTNAVMDKLYRDKLRYLVARYGAFTDVLAWEFWNEADITTGYRSDLSQAWHARMADYLRSIDPYAHLITTSFASTEGDRAVDTLPGIDYVQTHHYNSPDLARTLARAQHRKAGYGKPHFVGEIGADSGGPRGKDDPEGLQIHDPIWVSIVTGGAGTAQPWWWDNYIHPQNHYGHFAAAAQFVHGINWPAEGFAVAEPLLEWIERPRHRQDIRIADGPASWERAEFNQPRRLLLTTNGLSGDLPIASVLHGLGGHRDKHNPVTFHVDLPWPTRLEVEVGDVSGHGGAALQLSLDGNIAFTRDFADPDGLTNTTTLRQFVGSHGVDIPAGKHSLLVENIGRDWLRAGYRFVNAVEPVRPPLLGWSLVGSNTALAWIRVEERTWNRVAARKETVPPAPASICTLSGMRPGEWHVEMWDTWQGQVVSKNSEVADASGKLRVVLPPIEKDLALKLLRKARL